MTASDEVARLRAEVDALAYAVRHWAEEDKAERDVLRARAEKAEAEVDEVAAIVATSLEVAASHLCMPLLDRDDAQRQAEYLRSQARGLRGHIVAERLTAQARAKKAEAEVERLTRERDEAQRSSYPSVLAQLREAEKKAADGREACARIAKALRADMADGYETKVSKKTWAALEHAEHVGHGGMGDGEAVRRCYAAEARVAELEAQCAAMRALLVEAETWAPGDWGPKIRAALSSDAGRAYAERMAELERVAEAAREALDQAMNPAAALTIIGRALAALDEKGGGA